MSNAPLSNSSLKRERGGDQTNQGSNASSKKRRVTTLTAQNNSQVDSKKAISLRRKIDRLQYLPDEVIRLIMSRSIEIHKTVEWASNLAMSKRSFYGLFCGMLEAIIKSYHRQNWIAPFKNQFDGVVFKGEISDCRLDLKISNTGVGFYWFMLNRLKEMNNESLMQKIYMDFICGFDIKIRNLMLSMLMNEPLYSSLYIDASENFVQIENHEFRISFKIDNFAHRFLLNKFIEYIFKTRVLFKIISNYNAFDTRYTEILNLLNAYKIGEDGYEKLQYLFSLISLNINECIKCEVGSTYEDFRDEVIQFLISNCASIINPKDYSMERVIDSGCQLTVDIVKGSFGCYIFRISSLLSVNKGFLKFDNKPEDLLFLIEFAKYYIYSGMVVFNLRDSNALINLCKILDKEAESFDFLMMQLMKFAYINYGCLSYVDYNSVDIFNYLLSVIEGISKFDRLEPIVDRVIDFFNVIAIDLKDGNYFKDEHDLNKRRIAHIIYKIFELKKGKNELKEEYFLKIKDIILNDLFETKLLKYKRTIIHLVGVFSKFLSDEDIDSLLKYYLEEVKNEKKDVVEDSYNKYVNSLHKMVASFKGNESLDMNNNLIKFDLINHWRIKDLKAWFIEKLKNGKLDSIIDIENFKHMISNKIIILSEEESRLFDKFKENLNSLNSKDLTKNLECSNRCFSFIPLPGYDIELNEFLQEASEITLEDIFEEMDAESNGH